MLDWIVEGLRWIVWGFTAAALTLMDVCYDLVKQIATADFLTSSEVWGWYYIFMAFIGVLISVRAFSVFMKFSFDEEFREKVNAQHFINKFITIALVIALLPLVLGFVSQVSLWGINNISRIVGTTGAEKPSTFVITSFMNTDNGQFTEDGLWVEGNRVTYTISDVDINEEGTGDEDYKFFNSIENLFIVAIIGVASAIMLIINGIQIAKRMYALVMKVIIAPVPISSLIVPGDETFTMWRKMILSDYFLNFIQTLMIMVVMVLSGSKVIQQFGVWAQIISFIAGLLLLLSGIPELAKIIGGDTSQANVLQQIASFRLATRGAGGAIAGAVGSAAGIATTGGAVGVYGAGRMLGGQSIKDMQKMQEKGNNGFMGGSQYEHQEQQGYSYQNHKENNQVAGANVKNESNQQESNSLGMNMKQDSMQSSSEMSSSFGGTNTTQSQQIPQGKDGYIHSSREGTFARNYSNVANEMSGITGGAARFAANSSKHLYQSSMQRMQNVRLYQAGASIMKMTAKRSTETMKGSNI